MASDFLVSRVTSPNFRVSTHEFADDTFTLDTGASFNPSMRQDPLQVLVKVQSLSSANMNGDCLPAQQWEVLLYKTQSNNPVPYLEQDPNNETLETCLEYVPDGERTADSDERRHEVIKN
eukprot:10242407-Ditylum_brightwellii.AAC.1